MKGFNEAGSSAQHDKSFSHQYNVPFSQLRSEPYTVGFTAPYNGFWSLEGSNNTASP